jgi:hypothetical protein
MTENRVEGGGVVCNRKCFIRRSGVHVKRATSRLGGTETDGRVDSTVQNLVRHWIMRRKCKKTYPLLVTMTSFVGFPNGSLRRPTLAEMKELEVRSSIDVDVLKEPVIGLFDVFILAELA